MKLSPYLLLVLVICAVVAVRLALAKDAPPPTNVDDSPKAYPPPSEGGKVVLTDGEWRERLTSEEYRVLRKEGTERAFAGDLWNHKESGKYVCAACGLELFASDTKFKSGTGWPSYYQPIEEAAVGKTEDRAYGMLRTEVHCGRCGGHLGHIFNDGPAPTGLRYCINSASLDFRPTKAKK